MSHDAVAEHHRWISEVQDPAKAASAGEIRVDVDGWDATYEVAPIPGGWAWRAQAITTTGRVSGSGAPWHTARTREEAHEAALDWIADTTGQPIQIDLFDATA